jgi:hypothetical protein
MTVGALIDPDKVFVHHLTDRVSGNASCGGSDQATEDTAEQSSKTGTDGTSDSGPRR